MELRPKGCEFPVNGKDYTHKCGNFARKGKDFCWMHDGTPKKSERLQAENAKLKEQLILSESQNYCKICGRILEGETDA